MAKLNMFFVVAAVVLGAASALTDEERNSFREAAAVHVRKCADEFKITKEDIVAAKEAKNIDALDSCFYACFFKSIKVINEEGKFDYDEFMSRGQKYVKGADDLAKMAEIGKTCTSVNDETVTDGAKGCDRAKMFFGCLIKEKSLYLPFQDL